MYHICITKGTCYSIVKIDECCIEMFLVNVCLSQLTLPSSTKLLTQLKQMSPWDQEVSGWYGWAYTEINMLALPISFV